MNNEGILAFVTNNGYLDSPTFRGMRASLLRTFDKIYIVNLLGSADKKETAPDGSKDGNIFDIMRGVALFVGVKGNPSEGGRQNAAPTKDRQITAQHLPSDVGTTAPGRPQCWARVFYADIWGMRENKFRQLNDWALQFTEVDPDSKMAYLIFVPILRTSLNPLKFLTIYMAYSITQFTVSGLMNFSSGIFRESLSSMHLCLIPCLTRNPIRTSGGF